VKANDEGNYEFQDLKPGAYRVTLIRDGRRNTSEAVNVEAGKPKTVNLAASF
jgi:hypothetical protein